MHAKHRGNSFGILDTLLPYSLLVEGDVKAIVEPLIDGTRSLQGRIVQAA
jgi:hypothetical protein